MKLLTFQAETFAWTPFSRTLDDAAEATAGRLDDAVVVFVHAETADFHAERRDAVFRHALKHVKWLANKRDLKAVVLHSFTHLGGDTAAPALAQAFIEQLRDRLVATGYTVAITPFGWFCSWNLAVYGDSLAKVFKQID